MTSVPARGTAKPGHVFSLPVVRETPPAPPSPPPASSAWAVGGTAW